MFMVDVEVRTVFQVPRIESRQLDKRNKGYEHTCHCSWLHFEHNLRLQ